MQVSLLLMLSLDEELAQYFYSLWDVLERSPLFWAADVITPFLTTTLTTTTVIITMMLELSAPHVSYVFGTNWTAIKVRLVLATMYYGVSAYYTHCLCLFSLACGSSKYDHTLVQYPAMFPSHPSNNSTCLLYFLCWCDPEVLIKQFYVWFHIFCLVHGLHGVWCSFWEADTCRVGL